MRRPSPNASWPASWRKSFDVDLHEVFDQPTSLGYAYAYAARRRAALDAVRRHVAPGARILDVAAAQGNFTLALAEAGYEVTWNDLRADLEGYVRLKHELGRVNYLPGNVLELAPDLPFDAVLMTEVIEHVAHPDEFLAAVSRLCRPNGHIILTTPNGEYWRNKLPRFSNCADPSVYEEVQFKPDADGHIFLLHIDELKGIANACDLDIEELMFFTNSLTSGHVKTESALRIIPRSLVQAFEARTVSAGRRRTGRRANAQMLCVLRQQAADVAVETEGSK